MNPFVRRLAKTPEKGVVFGAVQPQDPGHNGIGKMADITSGDSLLRLALRTYAYDSRLRLTLS